LLLIAAGTILNTHFIFNIKRSFTMRSAAGTIIMMSGLIATVGVALLGAEPAGLKKRVAVFDFEDKSDHRIHWWRGDRNVGQGMADMLTTTLVKQNKYTVIERTQLEKIMKEQAMGASGAITKQSAAKIGKLLGVEVAIFGAVTEFGYSDEKTNIKAPVPTPFGSRSGGLKLGKKTARVGIDVRFVNTTTGEIIAAESVAKEESKGDVGVSVGGKGFENETKFDESMVGKATRQAIDEIVKLIGVQMQKVPWRGRVVKVTGPTVIINAGSAGGVKVGDELVVYSKGEELIDPETGVSLGSEETEVGKIKVESDMAGGKASKCSVISGSGGTDGDIVRYAQ
jgi:curli biogenesis system outer membrane secretion channel CsgG